MRLTFGVYFNVCRGSVNQNWTGLAKDSAACWRRGIGRLRYNCTDFSDTRVVGPPTAVGFSRKILLPWGDFAPLGSGEETGRPPLLPNDKLWKQVWHRQSVSRRELNPGPHTAAMSLPLHSQAPPSPTVVLLTSDDGGAAIQETWHHVVRRSIILSAHTYWLHDYERQLLWEGWGN